MPQLYSYVRWSSDKQTKGTTLERQMASAKLFANDNGLDLVEIIEPGVSAFKGKNAKDGKLGDFINAVEAGVIDRDSWLYVENLDRLTRQKATDAQTLFIRLLNLGLTLVTGMDKRIYTLESVKSNPTEFMISILLFSRANEESTTKSKRTTGNVLTMIQRHKEGLPVNIKSVGKHPWWIDDSGSQFEAVRKHEKDWPIAREIIDLYLSGYGAYKVKRHLDTKYPEQYNGKEWDYQTLIRMRKNRALIGERNLTIDGKNFRLDNYYPSLCIDEAEFIRLEELKSKNNFQSKDSKGEINIKLLSGLSLLRCGKCGGTMSSFMNKGKPRYICLNGRHLQKGCQGWSVNALTIEQCVIIALIIGYMDNSTANVKDPTILEKQIIQKQEDLILLDKSISNISFAIEQGVNLSSMVSRLKELSSDRDLVVSELDKLKKIKVLQDSKGSYEVAMSDFLLMVQWGILLDTANETRNNVRSVISSIIESVIVDKIDGCISIKIKLIGRDVIFIFTGINRKPQWQFDVEFNSEDKAFLDKSDNEINEHVLTETDIGREVLSKAFKQLDVLRKTYLNLLNHVTKEVLPVVGYPNIDGGMFWPNTSGGNKVLIEYNQKRYNVSLSGNLPQEVHDLIKESKLTRKKFIDTYKITEKNEVALKLLN